jgi:hypothetical protein
VADRKKETSGLHTHKTVGPRFLHFFSISGPASCGGAGKGQ